MNWFQRLRRYIIIKTAESYYEKMARMCIERHKETKMHHYIIIDPWLAKKIVITNRADFRATKRAINDSGIRMMEKGRYNSMRMLEDAQYQITDMENRLRELQRNPEKNAEMIKLLTKKIGEQRQNETDAKMRLKNLEGIFTDAAMPDVHSGCYYSSKLQTDLNRLQQKPVENERAIRKLENDIEARRRAYIKWTLENAKIRKHKTRQQRKEEREIRKELKRYRKGKGLEK
jgi:predicted  nucleic acid-binding Zn-ribbon protein